MSSVNQEDSVPAAPGLDTLTKHATLTQILENCASNGILLPEDSLIPLARGILSGLTAVHETGGVYGGVWPDSVGLSEERGFFLVEQDGYQQDALCDAGVDMRVVYLVPEAILTGQWVPVSDVFSAGTVLWQCLMGIHPYQYRHDEPMQDVHRHICHDAPLVPPGLAGRSLELGLMALVSVMLIKDPDLRPGAEDLLRTIQIGQANHSTQPKGVLPPPVLGSNNPDKQQ